MDYIDSLLSNAGLLTSDEGATADAPQPYSDYIDRIVQDAADPEYQNGMPDAGISPEDGKAPVGAFRHTGNEVLRGLSRTVTAGVGLVYDLPKLLITGERSNVGGEMQKGFDEWAAVDPEMEKSFWTGTLPQGAGSMLSFLIPGMGVTKVAKVLSLSEKASAWLGTAVTMASGAAAQGGQGYQEAIEMNASDGKVIASALANAAIGTSEALPIGRFLKVVSGLKAGTKILPEAILEGLEEAIQETGQQIGSNETAKLLYDTNRGLMDGVAESGAAGGLLGFLMGATGAKLHHMARAAQENAGTNTDAARTGTDQPGAVTGNQVEGQVDAGAVDLAPMAAPGQTTVAPGNVQLTNDNGEKTLTPAPLPQAGEGENNAAPLPQAGEGENQGQSGTVAPQGMSAEEIAQAPIFDDDEAVSPEPEKSTQQKLDAATGDTLDPAWKKPADLKAKRELEAELEGEKQSAQNTVDEAAEEKAKRSPVQEAQTARKVKMGRINEINNLLSSEGTDEATKKDLIEERTALEGSITPTLEGIKKRAEEGSSQADEENPLTPAPLPEGEGEAITDGSGTLTSTPQPKGEGEYKLPADMGKSAPRYGLGNKNFALTFGNDLDKGAHIIASAKEGVKSSAHDRLLSDMVAKTGMSEAEIVAHGQKVKAQVKQSGMAHQLVQGENLKNIPLKVSAVQVNGKSKTGKAISTTEGTKSAESETKIPKSETKPLNTETIEQIDEQIGEHQRIGNEIYEIEQAMEKEGQKPGDLAYEGNKSRLDMLREKRGKLRSIADLVKQRNVLAETGTKTGKEISTTENTEDTEKKKPLTLEAAPSSTSGDFVGTGTGKHVENVPAKKEGATAKPLKTTWHKLSEARRIKSKERVGKIEGEIMGGLTLGKRAMMRETMRAHKAGEIDSDAAAVLGGWVRNLNTNDPRVVVKILNDVRSVSDQEAEAKNMTSGQEIKGSTIPVLDAKQRVNGALIKLYRGNDASTAIHEIYHAFLFLAPIEIRKAAQAHFGEGWHEKTAEAGVRYYFEGRVAGLPAKLADWFRHIAAKIHDIIASGTSIEGMPTELKLWMKDVAAGKVAHYEAVSKAHRESEKKLDKRDQMIRNQGKTFRDWVNQHGGLRVDRDKNGRLKKGEYEDLVPTDERGELAKGFALKGWRVGSGMRGDKLAEKMMDDERLAPFFSQAEMGEPVDVALELLNVLMSEGWSGLENHQIMKHGRNEAKELPVQAVSDRELVRMSDEAIDARVKSDAETLGVDEKDKIESAAQEMRQRRERLLALGRQTQGQVRKSARAEAMAEGLKGADINAFIESQVAGHKLGKGAMEEQFQTGDMFGAKSSPEEIEAQRGREAIEQMIHTKKDMRPAMQRKDLGDVSFIWGREGDASQNFKGGEGVAKIIAKHGLAAARMMPEVIAKGKLSEEYGPQDGRRVNVSHKGHTAVLSLYRFGEKETWLLTGWEDYEASDGSGEGNGSSEPTPSGPMRTRPDGGAEADKNIVAEKTVENKEKSTTKSAEGPKKSKPSMVEALDKAEREAELDKTAEAATDLFPEEAPSPRLKTIKPKVDMRQMNIFGEPVSGEAVQKEEPGQLDLAQEESKARVIESLKERIAQIGKDGKLGKEGAASGQVQNNADWLEDGIDENDLLGMSAEDVEEWVRLAAAGRDVPKLLVNRMIHEIEVKRRELLERMEFDENSREQFQAGTMIELRDNGETVRVATGEWLQSHPALEKRLEGTKVAVNGRPQVVYHGTRKTYRSTDKSKMNPDSLYGPGVYLTEDPDIAAQYAGLPHNDSTPNIRPGFARIAEPFDMEKVYATGKLRDIFNEMGIGSNDLLEVIGSDEDLASKEQSQHGLTGRQFYEMLTGEGLWDKAEIHEGFQRAGFDGITHVGGIYIGKKKHQVWIAFDSEQVVPAYAPEEQFQTEPPPAMTPEERENQTLEERQAENAAGEAAMDMVEAQSAGTSSGTFLDKHEEVRKRFEQAAGRFKPEGSMIRRAWKAMRDFGKAFVSPTPHLITSRKELLKMDAAERGERNRLREWLRVQKQHKQYASIQAKTWMQRVLEGLKPQEDIALLREAAVVRDLQYDLDKKLGKTVDGEKVKLPFGLTPALAQEWVADVEARVKANPRVEAALKRRDALFQRMGEELVRLKILEPFQAANPHYVHHIIMEYNIGEMMADGTGNRLKAPKNRPYSRHRYLNDKDYVADLLKLDFITLSQMMTDILDQRLVDKIATSKLNRWDAMSKEAKKRTQIAQGLNPKAREVSIFDIVDEHPGWQVWATHPGIRRFTYQGIKRSVITELASRLMTLPKGSEAVIKVGRDDMTTITEAAGYQLLILPTDISEQLDDLHNEDFVGTAHVINNLIAPVTTLWKKAMLFTPFRAVRYGINNLIGDIEGIMMAAPGVMRGGADWKKTFADLTAYYKDGEMSPELREAVRVGVLSGGITAAELRSTFHDIPAFAAFYDAIDRQEEGNVKAAARMVAGVLMKIPFKYGQQVNEFRESILRYKAFLYYSKGLAKGEDVGSGASRIIELEGLTNAEKAARLSREVLIDYEAISALGQVLRRGLMPFYSWTEGNIRRYKRILENVWLEQTNATFGQKAMSAIAPATRISLAVALFTGGIAIWNKLLFWDDDEAEEGMAEYVKTRGFIMVAPPNSAHEASYIRAATATRDMLEWAGVSEWPDVWRDLRSGQITMAQALAHTPKAAVNKVVGGLGPAKSLAEAAFGKSLFPDIFEPTPMRGIDTALARAWGMDREWMAMKDWFTPVPAKGAGSYWMGLLGVKKNDPGLGAYSQIMDLKARFRQNVLNQEGSADFHTPKSDLARQYRLARKWGDAEAEAKIEELMRDMGMRGSAINKALESANPLMGLSKKNRREFEDWLTPDQRRLLEQANNYYEETFR